MTSLTNQASLPRMDSFNRVLILLATFFSIAALSLLIVGTATYAWHYTQYTNGTTDYSNLFTRCKGNTTAKTSVCSDIARNTDFGVRTRNAAAFIIVAICLVGCAMLVILLMNFIQLTTMVLFTAPITLFLATLFLVATFAEASRAMYLNGYSAILVQTAHITTIFTLTIITFACGRLQLYYYNSF